jgi:hypothetical protein
VLGFVWHALPEYDEARSAMMCAMRVRTSSGRRRQSNACVCRDLSVCAGRRAPLARELAVDLHGLTRVVSAERILVPRPIEKREKARSALVVADAPHD